MASHPEASIPVACEQDGARLEGFYKLVRNDAVEPEAIRQSAFAATSEMAKGTDEDLLLVHDTTSISPVHSLREKLRSKMGTFSHGGRMYDDQLCFWSNIATEEMQSIWKDLSECECPCRRGV